MPALSFVTTFYNRPEQLRNTLTVLKDSIQSGDQIVIVDDASEPNLSARRVLSGFDLPVELVEIRPERKWWINPGIPYNIGFQMANRDAVVIMNSEAIPMGGAIEHLRMQVRSDNYVVMPCYSTTEAQFKSLCQVRSSPASFANVLMPFNQSQWYHHPVHSNHPYHFMSCITTDNLKKRVRGFDERFAKGYCWDDNSFLYQVQKVGLRIESRDENFGYVVHQYHQKNLQFRGGCSEWERNRQLFLRIQSGQEPSWTEVGVCL